MLPQYFGKNTNGIDSPSKYDILWQSLLEQKGLIPPKPELAWQATMSLNKISAVKEREQCCDDQTQDDGKQRVGRGAPWSRGRALSRRPGGLGSNPVYSQSFFFAVKHGDRGKCSVTSS